MPEPAEVSSLELPCCHPLARNCWVYQVEHLGPVAAPGISSEGEEQHLTDGGDAPSYRRYLPVCLQPAPYLPRARFVFGYTLENKHPGMAGQRAGT